MAFAVQAHPAAALDSFLRFELQSRVSDASVFQHCRRLSRVAASHVLLEKEFLPIRSVERFGQVPCVAEKQLCNYLCFATLRSGDHRAAGYSLVEKANFSVQSLEDKKLKNEKSRRKNVTRLYSMAVPFFVLAAGPQVIEGFSNWKISQAEIKSIYMVFSLVFCWGCCVFGSMKDPFYDSEQYRKGGGDGTQHYLYHVEEIEEQMAREELWREELLQELDEKVGELKDIEEKEREKELV